MVTLLRLEGDSSASADEPYRMTVPWHVIGWESRASLLRLYLGASLICYAFGDTGPFPRWNDGAARETIIVFVDRCAASGPSSA